MIGSRELELQIEEVERLKVRLVNEKGMQVRADGMFSDYPYKRAADGSLTVAAWKQSRFCKHFEGYCILIIGEDGNAAHGRSLLKNLRTEKSTASVERALPNEPMQPHIIENPVLVRKKGGPFPTVEVDVDHLPYIGAFEEAVYSAVKKWIRTQKTLSGPATIWKFGTQSCNFIEHGLVRSVYLTPLGFSPKFLVFLYSHLESRLGNVRYGEYVCPSTGNGWAAMCHIQDGRVYRELDDVTWSEV